MRGEAENEVLIGVDAGASRVRVWRVRLDARGALASAPPPAERCWPSAANPVRLELQLAEHARGSIELTASERADGALRIRCTADAVLAVSETVGARRVRVAVAAAGLATADRRGIAVLRHGPRIPQFLARLEEALAASGLIVGQGRAELVPDGVAAALGEEASARGSLRDVRTGLLVAAGTGMAEALKLEGRVLGTAPLRRLISAPWDLVASDGATLEDRASMSALAARWRRVGGDLATRLHPEAAALEGDATARDLLAAHARGTAEFVADRLARIRARAETRIERVVLGQHTARLYADERLAPHWRAHMQARLAELCEPSVRELLVASPVSEAAALGAVALDLGLVGVVDE